MMTISQTDQVAKIQSILSRNKPKDQFRIMFGIHRGSLLSDVPYRYLCWLENNIEPSDKPKLIAAVEKEIEIRKKNKDFS